MSATFSLVTELSLQEQVSTLQFGKAPKYELQELAAHLALTAPGRIAFCRKQLAVLGQDAEFYNYWKDTRRLWEKAERLSDSSYNLYL